MEKNVDLSSGGWNTILSEIQSGGKYVALDLSACTMTSGAVFDPGTAETGESLIVSLVLPDAATSIKMGTQSAPAFKNFTALKSVAGEEVTTVGDWAFSNCYTLTAVSLPEAVTIGARAFSNCHALETVSLPKAATIGDYAFYYCGGYYTLETVSLPEAVTIGDWAFTGCLLKTVNLPKAATIGDYAFCNCPVLETVSLPKAATIGERAFMATGTTKALTITLGDTPPKLGVKMFDDVPNTYVSETGTKSVTVKVPATASGYAVSLPATYSNAENTTGGSPHWGEGFRGKGWTSGGAYGSNGALNENINLTIRTE